MSVLLQRPSHPEPKGGSGSGLVDNMRAAFRSSHRRNSSLSTVPPPQHSSDYSPEHASIAASILYRSPLPSESGLPIYILNAAAFPDAFEVDYDTLLAYVLARLPGEEELIAGEDYEIIFFAGGQPDSATSEKKTGPGIGWYLQTYHVLSRAVRKRLSKLYVVHERSWVRVLIEVFGTIVSPKFKKKIVHVNTLSGLALHLPIEQLLIPPSVYLHDRRVAQDIYAPYVGGRRAFGADVPLPGSLRGEKRLPRVLRETTTFICRGNNLSTEGLFRIPPHSQLAGVLREAYDRGQKFIVWKEGPFMWAQPEMDPAIMREVGQVDTYGVHLAAGLIKLWYRELATPIFEESCYDEARRYFASADQDYTIEVLAQIFAPDSTSSFLSPTARYILTTHLLPLIALVASYQSANKMTVENLAICFAPALVRGEDQLADAKMTSVIRRVLEAAVTAWPNGLRETCGATLETFAVAISPPIDPRDYEDPLHEGFRPSSRDSSQHSGHRILLQDEESDSQRPALPPRPRVVLNTAFPTRQDSLSSPVKRKPAPPPATLSRYSAIVTSGSSDKSESPTKSSPIFQHPLRTDSNTESEAAPPYQTPRTPQTSTATAPQRTQSDLMSELRASLATDLVRRKPVSSPASPRSPAENEKNSPSSLSSETAKPSQQRSVSGDPFTAASEKSKDEGVFARPTWAASTRQVSAPHNIRAATLPTPSTTAPSTSTSTSTFTTIQASSPATMFSYTNSTTLSAPAPAFKARTPSPGLLKRMTSMEAMRKPDADTDRLLPSKHGLKQASVDDLRRLYEERAGAVKTLAVVSASSSRRGSAASSRRGSVVGMGV